MFGIDRKIRIWTNENTEEYRYVYCNLFEVLVSPILRDPDKVVEYCITFNDIVDKNGKDIYEHDILQDPNGKKIRVLGNNLTTAGTDTKYFGTSITSEFSIKELEVIGNVNETPDLWYNY